MNNSVFGKTMENLRKRVHVKLVMDEKNCRNEHQIQPSLSVKSLMKNWLLFIKLKTLILNRPAYLSMCILNLSKTLIYDFHYNYIKKKYDDKAKLLFTDTDSLTYKIETEDAYKDFWNKDKFDNGEHPENSPYFDKSNKKVIGKFKDEISGIPINEFIGLTLFWTESGRTLFWTGGQKSPPA